MFNAYDVVKNIYDMKTGWHTADKAGDRAKADEYAKNAQQYYKQLMDNGYSDVADAPKNTNDVGAKYIVDNFMKTYSTPVDTSKSSTPTATADLTKSDGMAIDLYGVQRADKDTISKKYDTFEDYIYNYDHSKSDIGKSILDNYKFQGETASNNATASGGASNGGNIDSYAAANANRQQLAYTNAGMNAVLNDFNARMNGIRGALSDLGINLQNQYKSMQDTIGLKQTDEQRKFDNDVKTSEVTGYVPESMSYANNPFLNDDGTVIDPHNRDFSQIKSNAETALKTETDPQRIADLKQTIRWAEQARLKKTEMEEYKKWANTTTAVAPQETLTSKTTNKQLENDKHAIDTESATSKYVADQELEGTKDTNATSKKIADASNLSAEKIAELEAQAESDETWQDVTSGVSGLSDDAYVFVNADLYSNWVNETSADIREVIEGVKYDANTNPNGYKLTKKDVITILNKMFPTITQFVLETDEKGNPTKTITVSEWINSQTWYNPKDD